MVILDLSAAFDTIDHHVLLSRLSSVINMSGPVLDWFMSYLSNRSQRVKIDSKLSTSTQLEYGVPQGSVLGPILFSIYMIPLYAIIRRYDISFHTYADDTQIYISFKNDSQSTEARCIQLLQNCIIDIKSWMADNFLKLNDKKTEVIALGTNCQLSNLHMSNFEFDNTAIKLSSNVRNLGAFFDKHMKLDKHVGKICQKSYFQLRNIGKIQKYLDKTTKEIIVHAFVTNNLDSLNSLLYGLPDYSIHRLQRILHSAARVVSNVRKYDHITETLKELHWLPIDSRIQYKILVMVHACINKIAPSYLCDLFTLYEPTRDLRSRDKLLLYQPSPRMVTYGERSFAYAGPKLWNKLEYSIRHILSPKLFKQKLKTYLFKIAYDI